VRTRLPRLPIEMNDADLNLRANPPQIGEHTKDILSAMGYGDEEILDLKKQSSIS